MFLHVTKATPLDGYRVAVCFDDGREGVADLTEALNRLAFAQPRQDDLLAYLRGLDEVLSTDEMEALQIRLEPPRGLSVCRTRAPRSDMAGHHRQAGYSDPGRRNFAASSATASASARSPRNSRAKLRAQLA